MSAALGVQKANPQSPLRGLKKVALGAPGGLGLSLTEAPDPCDVPPPSGQPVEWTHLTPPDCLQGTRSGGDNNSQPRPYRGKASSILHPGRVVECIVPKMYATEALLEL